MISMCIGLRVLLINCELPVHEREREREREKERERARARCQARRVLHKIFFFLFLFPFLHLFSFLDVLRMDALSTTNFLFFFPVFFSFFFLYAACAWTPLPPQMFLFFFHRRPAHGRLCLHKWRQLCLHKWRQLCLGAGTAPSVVPAPRFFSEKDFSW